MTYSVPNAQHNFMNKGLLPINSHGSDWGQCNQEGDMVKSVGSRGRLDANPTTVNLRPV